MATPAENLERFKEIARRGLQDQLPPEIKSRFDAAVERGLVELPAAPSAPTPQASRMDSLKAMNNPGIGEAALTVGSSMLGTVAGGLTGVGTLAATGGDADAAVGVMNRVRDGMTYEPRSTPSKMALGKLGDGMQAIDESPKMVGADRSISEGFNGIRQTLGNATLDATGSPGLAAVAHTSPDALIEGAFLGLPKILSGLRMAADKVKPAINAATDRGAALTGDAVQTYQPKWADVESARTQISTKLSEIADREIVGIGDDGKFSQEALKVIESVRGAKGLEWANNFNLFKEMGIEPTRVNITRSMDDYVQQADMAKKTGAVSDKLAAQSQGLQNNVGQRIDAFDPENFDSAATGEAIQKTLRDVVQEMDSQVDAAYAAAREASAGQPRIRLDGFMGAINSNRGMERSSGGIISMADGVAKNMGIMKTGQRINRNKREARNKGENTRMITVEEAYQIRKQLGRDYESANGAGQGMIRELQKAIDEDIIRVVGEDTFAGAKAANTAYHNAIGRKKADKHDISARQDSLLENIINGKVQGERIIGKLASADKRDVIALRDFLIERSGPKAWDEVKASILRDALEQATKNQTTLAGGVKDFKEATFVKYLANMGRDGKMNVIFNADELAWIKKIGKIGELRGPMVGVVNGSGPSGLAVETLGQKIISMADDKTMGLASKVTDHLMEGHRLRAIDGQAAASPRLSEVANKPDLRGMPPR